MATYHIPYSHRMIPIDLPASRVIFTGELPKTEELLHWQDQLIPLLDHPTAGPSLWERLSPGDHIVILVEDQTRHTPVSEILPVLIRYLITHGSREEDLEILIAPGTHRILTEDELTQKLGSEVRQRIKVSQHDYRDLESLVHLPDVTIGDLTIPVSVNRTCIEADLLIGLGNIIPHPNAGYSGGAKILAPGCCGPDSVSAAHTAAALMGYLPLGMKENDCRHAFEAIASAAGLDFIINVILNPAEEVVGIVTGDFVKAHRAGTDLSRASFGTPIPEEADILISCAYPYDCDFWQCEKSMVSGFFAVKEGGIMILPMPCLEGIAHNHDTLLDWLALSREEAIALARHTFLTHGEGDLVAAGIAIGALTASEKARIFVYSEGLSDDTIKEMGYRPFPSLQAAIDTALAEIPQGTIGILPHGGDCLPYLL